MVDVGFREVGSAYGNSALSSEAVNRPVERQHQPKADFDPSVPLSANFHRNIFGMLALANSAQIYQGQLCKVFLS